MFHASSAGSRSAAFSAGLVCLRSMFDMRASGLPLVAVCRSERVPRDDDCWYVVEAAQAVEGVSFASCHLLLQYVPRRVFQAFSVYDVSWRRRRHSRRSSSSRSRCPNMEPPTLALLALLLWCAAQRLFRVSVVLGVSCRLWRHSSCSRSLPSSPAVPFLFV